MKKALFYILAGLLVASTAFAGRVHPLNLVQETTKELIFSVEPEGWVEIDSGSGVVPVPSGAAMDLRSGGKVVPYYRGLIGLPSAMKPGVTILSQRWGDTVTGRLPDGDLTDPDSRLPNLSKAGTVIVGEPYKWRQRWVADIYVMPLKLEGIGARKLTSLRFKVTFKGSSTGLSRKSDPIADMALLNSKTANRWSIPADVPVSSWEEAWPEGLMFRMEIDAEGIYALTYEHLSSLGIDLSGFDPRSFRIYGNGGYMLAETAGETEDTELRENAILVEGEQDGSWDPGDRILFYGRSVNSWVPYQPQGEFRHTMNPFTYTNVYWLNIAEDGSNGLRMDPLEATEAPTFNTTQARSRIYSEPEVFIFYNDKNRTTGRAWYAAELSTGEQYVSTFNVQSPLSTEPAKIWMSQKRATGVGSRTYASVTINGTVIVQSFTLDASVTSFEIPAGVLRNGSNTMTFRMLDGHGLFNWYEVNYVRELESAEGRIDFDAFSQDGIARASVSGLNDPYIFDIFEYDRVKYVQSNTFTAESEVTHPRRYIAISGNNTMTPSNIRQHTIGRGEYPNGLRDTNLRATYLIITHDEFMDAVEPLETYIEERDNIEVIRVATSDIYSEFGWGVFSTTAIRDFLMYTNQYWTDEFTAAPSMCLLVGDGDYDYRRIVSNQDRTWVPPYENFNDCRDDWYAEFGGPDPEIIMGRLPFQSTREINSYLERLAEYEQNTSFGPWQSKLVMVADDEWLDTGPTTIDRNHMHYSETITESIVPTYMNVKKIYLGIYPTQFDPVTSGRLKPLANRDLMEAYNDGALLIQYMGHGNAHVWAHEQLFVDTRDASQVNAGKHEPIIFAATCSWGHYDRPSNEAFFEQLLGQAGGSIGVIAASRNTSGYSNYQYTIAFYEYFFENESPYSLGESAYLAKLDEGGTTNPYYHCFAEPGLLPVLPRMEVEVTDIDPDSLIALEEAYITSEVRYPGNGQPVTGFDGEAVVIVYDSFNTLTYMFTPPKNSQSAPVPFEYKMPGGTLFRGTVSVTNADFGCRFIVPKDVSYGSNDCWMQLFATDGEFDGVGAKTNISISPVSGSERDDTTPPEIDIYLDSRYWKEGEMTSSQPVLIVDISDTSGINLSGEIGHEIRVVIDDSEEIDITEFFFYNRDSYRNGSIETRLYDLEEGKHTLEVWAWDNMNNFARERTTFHSVDDAESIYFENVYNAPNPFDTDTHFTFSVFGADEATIKIFTASGRHIKTIGPFPVRQGYNGDQPEFQWDGRDHYGDPIANGVYLYKIKATSASGKKADTLGKLMRIR